MIVQFLAVPWLRRPTATEGGYAEVMVPDGWRIVAAREMDFGVSLILEKTC